MPHVQRTTGIRADDFRHRQPADPRTHQAGCIRIFADKKSGKNAEREELWKALDYLREGDTLVVPSLDRLGRSIQDLIAIVPGLRKRGVGFTSLHEALDTTTPAGAWSLAAIAPGDLCLLGTVASPALLLNEVVDSPLRVGFDDEPSAQRSRRICRTVLGRPLVFPCATVVAQSLDGTLGSQVPSRVRIAWARTCCSGWSFLRWVTMLAGAPL